MISVPCQGKLLSSSFCSVSKGYCEKIQDLNAILIGTVILKKQHIAQSE